MPVPRMPSFRDASVSERARNPYAAVDLRGTEFGRPLCCGVWIPGSARAAPPRNDDGRAPSPVFFGRPRAGPRYFTSSRSLSRGAERRQTRRGANPPVDGWRSHPMGRLASVPFLLAIGGTRLPALHGGVLRPDGPRFRERGPWPRLSASSWRQVVMPGSGAPPSPGRSGYVAPKPAAPHRSTAGFPGCADPASSRPHLRPLSHRCSVFTASHDDAPRRAG